MSLPLRLVLPAALTVALAAGCGGSSGVTSSVDAPTPAGASTATGASPSTSSSAAVDQTIRLSYAAGKVGGDTGTVKVNKGSTVAIVVSSDTAYEVHLHGYDKMVDVPAGGTATLTFVADIAGVFEVELEQISKRLTQIEVS